MIDAARFEVLSNKARVAEAQRAEIETEFMALRKRLEEAARRAAEAQAELRSYVEKEAGIRLK